MWGSMKGNEKALESLKCPFANEDERIDGIDALQSKIEKTTVQVFLTTQVKE